MRKTLRSACLLVSFLATMVHPASFAAEIGVTENRILLGESAPFTGAAAQIGIQYSLGAEVYFNQVNAAGGIHGRRVVLDKLDDKYEADLAAANTKKLINDDHVFALFGYVGTPTSNAALPIFNAEKVPFFAPFTGAEGLRNPMNRLVFNIRASYFDETEHLVDQLVNLSIKDIAVFYQNDAYGKAGLAGVERAMKSRGLSISALATVERNSTDVSAATSVLMAKQPAAIIQISAYQSCAALIRSMKAQGYNGSFYNVSFVGSQALANVLEEQGVGVVISQVVPFPYKGQLPIVKEYQKAMEAQGHGTAIDYSSLEGYIAAKVFTEGLKRAGRDLTRASLIDALETINPSNFDVGGFDVSFSPKSHSASKFVEMTMILPGKKFRD